MKVRKSPMFNVEQESSESDPLFFKNNVCPISNSQVRVFRLSIDFLSSDKDPGAQLFIPQQMHNKPAYFTQQLIKGIDTPGKYPLRISLTSIF